MTAFEVIALLGLLVAGGLLFFAINAELNQWAFGDALLKLPQHTEQPQKLMRGARISVSYDAPTGATGTTGYFRLWVVESGIVIKSERRDAFGLFSFIKPIAVAKSHCRVMRCFSQGHVRDPVSESFVLTFEGAPGVSIKVIANELTEQERQWLLHWAAPSESS